MLVRHVQFCCDMLTDLDCIYCSQWLWAQFAEHMLSQTGFPLRNKWRASSIHYCHYLITFPAVLVLVTVTQMLLL